MKRPNSNSLEQNQLPKKVPQHQNLLDERETRSKSSMTRQLNRSSLKKKRKKRPMTAMKKNHRTIKKYRRRTRPKLSKLFSLDSDQLAQRKPLQNLYVISLIFL